MGTKVGYYLVNLTVQRPGMAGSPVLHLTLGVNAVTGEVSGHGNITQAVAPPGGNYPVPQVSGVILHTGFGKDTMLVPLKGEYVTTFPPPAIGSVSHPLQVALAVDKSWNGKGAFTFGGHWINDCTVKSGKS